MSASADPTPEEILDRCQAIQRTWSADEERKRRKWSITGPVEASIEKTAAVFAFCGAVSGHRDV